MNSQLMRVVGLNPGIIHPGFHDPAVVLAENGTIRFGIEEERLTRRKHAKRTFPASALSTCLTQHDLSLDAVDHIAIPWKPGEKSLKQRFSDLFDRPPGRDSLPSTLHCLGTNAARELKYLFSERRLRGRLANDSVPIRFHRHHKCHAVSAFYPSGFENALVVVIDGRGESDTVTIWDGNPEGLSLLSAESLPNSLGHFYAGVTEFLGYRSNNGEGKVMGLAPHGDGDEAIRDTLRSAISIGPDFDVTNLTTAVDYETLFGRSAKSEGGDFCQWEKDLAYEVQQALEEIVLAIVERHIQRHSHSNVCLAGGVALNCKMNKQVAESPLVSAIFVQPIANDAGGALGAALLPFNPSQVPEMKHVYLGTGYTNDEVRAVLNQVKVSYSRPESVIEEIAERLADGELVGWFQGRMEMGPRALGHRSILADPRTTDTRDRINEFVKNREGWRPFAPSVLEEAASTYLQDYRPSPFMIDTFDSKPEKHTEIQAVLHPGDDTTRPQTVTQTEQPRYYDLIRAFETITGVPMVLNTSFNDHGEPIVESPRQALQDFYGMGLDTLVLEDYIVTKGA